MLMNFQTQAYYHIISLKYLPVGKTYRFRISNVGLTTSINFRIQGHKMKLVEVEGSHTLQNMYSSLDIHLGQSYSVLVTADQPAQDYYIAVSTRFTRPALKNTAVLHYSNSRKGVSGPVPPGPTLDIASSMAQARTIRYSSLVNYSLFYAYIWNFHVYRTSSLGSLVHYVLPSSNCLLCVIWIA